MTVTFLLETPIQFGERTINELSLRRPKGKDMRKLSTTPGMDDMLNMASKLAGEPPALIDEMDGADCVRLAEVIAGFLESTQKTGDGV